MDFDVCQEARSRQDGALRSLHVISKCGIEVLATLPDIMHAALRRPVLSMPRSSTYDAGDQKAKSGRDYPYVF
jgi:hypothetical protein